MFSGTDIFRDIQREHSLADWLSFMYPDIVGTERLGSVKRERLDGRWTKVIHLGLILVRNISCGEMIYSGLC